MRRAFSSRPSPAMVVALLALFVALGGSGYAAVKVNGKNIKNRSIAGKKLGQNTVTGTEIRESKLGTVPSAKNATQLAGRDPTAFLPIGGTAANSNMLGGRDPGTFLSSGGTAVDSDKLGGLPPSSWVRRECGQTSGQIKGVAAVEGSSSYTSTFTAVPGYNCSGQSVESNHESMGRYQVRFNGSPVTRAVATAVVSGFSADAIGITNNGAGLFTVYVLDPSGAGTFVDDGFTLIAP